MGHFRQGNDMKNSITAMVAICLLAFTLPATSAVVDGVEVPELLPAEGNRPALHLNGAAKRKFLLFVDVYVGSLYVEKISEDPSQLLTADSYRRMQFQMLRNVRGRKIADAFYEGMQLNVSNEEAQGMVEQINQMVSMFDQRLSKGDVAVVEYIPGIGTHVVLAGNDRGVIPGKDIFDAILSIWIGEYPVSQEFKAGILGVETLAADTATGSNRYRRKENDF